MLHNSNKAIITNGKRIQDNVKAAKGRCKVKHITGHEGPERGEHVLLYSFFNLGVR